MKLTRRGITLGVIVVGLVALSGGAGVLVLRPSAPSAAGPPHLVDDTAASGISQRFDGPDLYQVGGGVAVLDCDGDGLPDVYLAGGAGPARLFRNVSDVGGALRFEPVASPTTDLSGATGAYPLDIDGDGRSDLVVLRVGENVILRNTGDCTFVRANEAFGFAGTDGFSTAFSAAWEGSATLPTLAIGHYLSIGPDGDTTFDCADNVMLRPDPGATRYGAPTPLLPGYCALSMLFSDWDRSGRRDLRVTNDRQYYRNGMDQLWRMAEGEAPRLYTAADGWAALQIWGMGIASHDVTGDGLPDVFLTSQADNKLQTLSAGPGQPSFRDIALKRGVTSAVPNDGVDHLPSTAWHPEFADVNNDGFIDLFISKGNVGAQVDYASRDPSDLFLGQPDGTFVQGASAAGIIRYDRGRGAALADFNLDGMLDLIVVNYGADTLVWRNVGSGTADRPAAMGGWLALRLEQPGPNRDAIGAWIEVKAGGATTRHEVTIGGGHISGQLGWIHFGLGSANGADVRVQWPDGEIGPWAHVDADGFAIIDRAASAPTHFVPGGS